MHGQLAGGQPATATGNGKAQNGVVIAKGVPDTGLYPSTLQSNAGGTDGGGKMGGAGVQPHHEMARSQQGGRLQHRKTSGGIDAFTPFLHQEFAGGALGGTATDHDFISAKVNKTAADFREPFQRPGVGLRPGPRTNGDKEFFRITPPAFQPGLYRVPGCVWQPEEGAGKICFKGDINSVPSQIFQTAKGFMFEDGRTVLRVGAVGFGDTGIEADPPDNTRRHGQ